MNGAVIGHGQIEALIPHKGAMCLWQQVSHWDADKIHLQSHSHRDLHHPLRSDGMLRAVHLCEYGAQAMAVHGGLLAQAGDASAARAGMLVALRTVELHVDRIDTLPGAIECEAQVVANSAVSQQYQFTIRHADALLAQGRATVMLQAP